MSDTAEAAEAMQERRTPFVNRAIAGILRRSVPDPRLRAVLVLVVEVAVLLLVVVLGLMWRCCCCCCSR